MIKIKRTKNDKGIIRYCIEKPDNPYAIKFLNKRQFYELLEDIKAVSTFPHIIKKTRMLELLFYGSRTLMENVYHIDDGGGWTVSVSGFTLRDLEEIYKTSMLLMTYDYDQFFEKHIAPEAQNRSNKK